jgi:hypothetical protein
MRAKLELPAIRTKFMLEEGSKFRGYKDPSTLPSLGYRVVDYVTVYEPLPPGKVVQIYGGWPVFQPDYYQIFQRFDVRHDVEDLGAKEICLWVPGVHPSVPGYDPAIHKPEDFRGAEESNMSSPTTGDVSNSFRDNTDLPVYSKTYVMYGYNPHRGESENVHNHGHQLESMLSYVNQRQDGNTDLFWGKFSGPTGGGREGHTHFPQNATRDYDYANMTSVLSDIADWTPDGIGKKVPVNGDTWGRHAYAWPVEARQTPGPHYEEHWYIYWMQSMPGRGNTIPYGSNGMTNWWQFTGDWDGSIRAGRGLYAPGPVSLASLTMTPATVAGCRSATGTVTLSGPAPAGGVLVRLSDTHSAASVPASVTVPAGASSQRFPITTTPVSSSTTGNMSATYGGITKSASLTVRPIRVQSLSLTPNPVVGPNTVTGTVTLECPAAPGNIVVTLASSNPLVAKPKVSSITIPAGTRSKTFLVTTANVSSTRSATIKATANGGTRSVVLTVK